MTELYQTLTDWYMSHMNYWTITGLMAIESSFIPFPSEAVIPPAAWMAAKGELNIYLVVFFGTMGAMIGAIFNYYIAKTLGRALVYKLADTRLASFFLINPAKVQSAEDYFLKHGNSSTFIGRLIPGIRQLISIPAGLSKMTLAPFLIYTALGAILWNIVLAVLGFFLYSQKALFETYYAELSWALIGLAVLFVAYLAYNGLKKKTSEQ